MGMASILTTPTEQHSITSRAPCPSVLRSLARHALSSPPAHAGGNNSDVRRVAIVCGEHPAPTLQSRRMPTTGDTDGAARGGGWTAGARGRQLTGGVVGGEGGWGHAQNRRYRNRMNRRFQACAFGTKPRGVWSNGSAMSITRHFHLIEHGQDFFSTTQLVVRHPLPLSRDTKRGSKDFA
jgi:hypothetical protein